MDTDTSQLSIAARRAVAARDWARVDQCATEIAQRSPDDAESPFLLGLVQKAARQPEAAATLFRKALTKDKQRYDAAIELANLNVVRNRYDEARGLLGQYRDQLKNSPLYLDMAAQAYSRMGLYDAAWPLHQQASTLQPEIESFQVHLASCAVYLGKIDEARSIYRGLLKRHPTHQQTHYELAQLDRAEDTDHIDRMLEVLKNGDPQPGKNIYLYYALGKEYEDLGQWDDSFVYYEKAGNAVKSVANYDVSEDVGLIDKIIEVCSSQWLANSPAVMMTDKTPVFVVGLPRTGTTLTDRILSSHSQVQSAGESQLLQMVLRNGTVAGNQIGISAAQIEAAVKCDPATIAKTYVEAIAHRLGDASCFIEKLPENVLYLGFIAKAWPDAKIVHLRRHPMDACFAVFKQSYFRFAYSLDDLAEYYLAYDRLSRHWREVLGPRIVELEYEKLVTDHEGQTRRLLDELGLEFEDACLRFDQNVSPIATASSVQVRQKVHTASVGKWKKFKRQLQPLQDKLEQGGVSI